MGVKRKWTPAIKSLSHLMIHVFNKCCCCCWDFWWKHLFYGDFVAFHVSKTDAPPFLWIAPFISWQLQARNQKKTSWTSNAEKWPLNTQKIWSIFWLPACMAAILVCTHAYFRSWFLPPVEFHRRGERGWGYVGLEGWTMCLEEGEGGVGRKLNA